MKIYKRPKLPKITCDCGCTFRPDYSDIYSECNRDGTITRGKYARCPICSTRIPITFKGVVTGKCFQCNAYRDGHCALTGINTEPLGYCYRFAESGEQK